MQAGETSDDEAFVRELAQRVPQRGDGTYDHRTTTRTKGIEKGIQPGRQEGHSESERKATLKIANTVNDRSDSKRSGANLPLITLS